MEPANANVAAGWGRFFEIFGESLFGLCKVHIRFCGGVHSVPSYLRFHRCNSQFLSAGGLKVDLALDTFGPSVWSCSPPACCNRCLYGNYPVLLGVDMRLVEVAKNDLKEKLALLQHFLWGRV